MTGLSDAEQTKQLRLARTEEKRTVKDLNQIGKRIEWVRLKLELTQVDVCEGTGIPKSSYCGREANVRAELIEEYFVLAKFFNDLWVKKFTDSKPSFNGTEVKKISFEWIVVGYSDIEASTDLIINDYQINMRNMENEFFDREADLVRQINMFARDEL
jgi:hypothetical protein